jgi:hypothetical protein
VWYISQEEINGQGDDLQQAEKCPLCPVLAGLHIWHTCGWDQPVGEIPQNSCNNGDKTYQLQMVGSPASSNATAWCLRKWPGRVLLWTLMTWTSGAPEGLQG